MKNVVLSLKSQVPLMLKSELHRWLAASVLFSVLLVVARTVYTGEFVFFFLVWNLFLAYVPYFISGWLQLHPAWIESRWRFAAAFICWLLFIPNSFYIITDLFHLRNYFTAPMWYDLALILSFAWNGLLAGILSVRQMEKMTQLHVGYRSEFFFIFPIMFLNAFGVYVGRYLRFNSWDVLSSPFGVITKISKALFHSETYDAAWGMICCYSALMTIIYITIMRIKKARL
jgi:uncharacterized membrane protein